MKEYLNIKKINTEFKLLSELTRGLHIHLSVRHSTKIEKSLRSTDKDCILDTL